MQSEEKCTKSSAQALRCSAMQDLWTALPSASTKQLESGIVQPNCIFSDQSQVHTVLSPSVYEVLLGQSAKQQQCTDNDSCRWELSVPDLRDRLSRSNRTGKRISCLGSCSNTTKAAKSCCLPLGCLLDAHTRHSGACACMFKVVGSDIQGLLSADMSCRTESG